MSGKCKADASPCGENELYGLIYALRDYHNDDNNDNNNNILLLSCTPGDSGVYAARAPLARPRGEPDKTREEGGT